MPNRIPVIAAAASLAMLLGACASYDGRGLQPGAATDADVRQLMGTPAEEFANPDGSRQIAYPRGPLGVETFMVHLRPDGRLDRIEQVLNEAHFDKIIIGKTTREEVRRLIGPPAETQEFRRQQQVSWTYRYRDAWGLVSDYSVTFDTKGIVVSKISIRVESPLF